MNVSKVDTQAYFVNLGILVSCDVHIHVACNTYKSIRQHLHMQYCWHAIKVNKPLWITNMSVRGHHYKVWRVSAYGRFDYCDTIACIGSSVSFKLFC